jgi:hypothetical protein
MDGFISLLVCKDEMSFKQQVNEVDKTKNPTPAYDQEQYEHNNVYKLLRSKHNRQSYKAFYNPTNEGNEKKNSFHKCGLAVKPFIKLHSAPP